MRLFALLSIYCLSVYLSSLLSSFFDAASNGNLDVEENEDKITDEL